ncbi:MAG: helix-turn-helix transcriptional regulator [Saprospiraceae bacterium]|nr:helix-turn-helix transcriptional regulator [Saprospiraceae bacterium]
MVELTEHLQNERIKRGLTKRALAKLLNVGIDTIIDWEFGRKQPPPKYAKTIIDFLGYVQFGEGNRTLGQQLYHVRLLAGKTEKQMVEIKCCDS